MKTDCKICNSEKREYIEQLILQGNSNLLVSTTLKDMGEDISHASVNRHKTRHMPESADIVKAVAHEKDNRKYDREDSKNSFEINANAIYAEIKSQSIHSINYDELAKNNYITHLMLSRIVNNQLAIAIDMQEKYMKGEAKFPNEQIRGLQIVQDLMLKFDVYTRQHFDHYNKLANSKRGISTHIYELGRKAKAEYELKNPYRKGDIFRIFKAEHGDDSYFKMHMPINPYNDEKECEIFDRGIDFETSQDEKTDFKLYLLLQDDSVPLDVFNKYIQRFSTTDDYNALDEINGLKKKYKIVE